MLQRGTILQAVTWHHLDRLQVRLHPSSPQVYTNPVIMVSSHNESSRMLHAVHRLDVVQGGDAEQVGELLLLVAAPVVADPGVAHSELVESEQVHHTEILREISLGYLGQISAAT